MNRLLILTTDADDYSSVFRDSSHLHDLEILSCSRVEDAREVIQNCTIVLGDPAMVAAVLEQARSLRWVQSTFAGIDPLCEKGLRRDYILTGVKGIFGPLMSEYVFAYILALERHLFETRENQRKKSWIDIPYRSLRTLTMGVCGLGSVGECIAQTGAHFGMRVLGFKRTPTGCPYVEKVYTGSSFGEFLESLDYLVVALPRTLDTNRLIDSAALSKMKPSAVLINVGRGNAVVESDLVDALRDGTIRAAVLDVFQQEPLPSDSALWGLSNAFITPHNSALSFPEDIVQIFCDNYRRLLDHRPLHYVVDFERGY